MKIFNVKNIAYMASTVLFLAHSAHASMDNDDHNDGPRTPKRGIARDPDTSENDENINFTPNVNRYTSTPSAPKKLRLTRAERRAIIRARNEEEIYEAAGVIAQQIIADALRQLAPDDSAEN